MLPGGGDDLTFRGSPKILTHGPVDSRLLQTQIRKRFCCKVTGPCHIDSLLMGHGSWEKPALQAAAGPGGLRAEGARPGPGRWGEESGSWGLARAPLAL